MPCFCNETRRKARKEHYCALCALPIMIGEYYYAVQSEHMGFHGYSLHTHCREVVLEYTEANHTDYWDIECIDEYIVEKYCCHCTAACKCFCAVDCPKVIRLFMNKER